MTKDEKIKLFKEIIKLTDEYPSLHLWFFGSGPKTKLNILSMRKSMLKNYVDGEPTAKIAISHNRSIETVAESFRSALWHLEKFKNPQYSQYVDRSIKQFEKMINS